MPDDLSDRTIALVKATVPALEQHGLAITRRMYERMFQNEAIRDLFNQSHHGESGSQPKALAAAILAYARNIEGLAALAPAVERIAQKHVGLNILPEHYPYVAEALLGAIKDVLGDAATEEILAAWGEAYWYLAEVLIARERAIYSSVAAAPGGWTGWRDFRVERKERESDVITSFVLRPADGGPVMRHRPGQYLTFWLEIPGHHAVKRNYSISSAANGETYRISVKREPHGRGLGLAARQRRAGHHAEGGAARRGVLHAPGVGAAGGARQRRRRADAHDEHAGDARGAASEHSRPLRPRHAGRVDPRHGREGARVGGTVRRRHQGRDLLRAAAPRGPARGGSRRGGLDHRRLAAIEHAHGGGGLLPLRPAGLSLRSS